MKKEIDIAKDNGFKQTDLDDLFAVNSVKSGKVSDFDKIMNKYYNIVLRKMMQYYNGNESKAEDCTAKVMVIVYENISKWSAEKGKFRNWVYKIAHTTFVDEYRKSKLDDTVSLDALFTNNKGESFGNQVASEDLNLEEKLELKSDIKDLKTAISSLKETDRQIIEMRYFYGMCFKDISKELNINLSTCRVSAIRILGKLKKKLS